MRYWLIAHRYLLCSILSALVPIGVWLSADQLIPLPQVLAAYRQSPLAPFAALLVTPAVAILMDRTTDADVCALRPTRWYRAAGCALLVLVPAVICVLLALADAVPFGLAAARNILAFAGMTLVGYQVGLRVAALVPTGFAVLAAVFGNVLDSDPRLWSWPMAPWQAPVAAIWCGVWVAMGVWVLTRAGTALTATFR